MKHQKLFEQLAARTLATASEAFPFLLDFRPHEILQAEGLELTADNCRMAEATLSWLHDEGFLRCLGSSRRSDAAVGGVYLEFRKSRLTAAGLTALNQAIDVSGGQKAGDVLVDQLKESASNARSAIISDIIGRIIGAAAKTFFGGAGPGT